MKKNEKGITLTTLVITIIIILILAGTLTYAGSSIIKSAKLQTINTDLLLIQAKVKTLEEKANFEGKPELLVGVNINTNTQLLNSVGITTVQETDKFYSISNEEDLNKLGVSVNTNSEYIVNYTDGEVYYVEGYKHTDGKKYYKLSEISNLSVD